MSRSLSIILLIILNFALVPISKADTESSPTFFLEMESTINYRDSDANRFRTSFPFPPAFLPVGADSAFLETVNAGSHLEISNIAFKGGWKLDKDWVVLFKVDAIDLYDRNPTSEDQTIDLDQILVRYGTKSTTKRPGGSGSYYIQLGKFAKFERQNDRHLQSYGLASTALNRFEDSGLEFGINLTEQLYLRSNITTGNPVFMRDPNALAGDNGISDFRIPPNNPDPELKSGILIIYDAEVEHFNLDKNPEIGLAIGYRSKDDESDWRSDLMIWAYYRELAEERELNGTFYDADLDLLNGSRGFSLPIKNNDKSDLGFNYWLYWDPLTLFIQVGRQELAGLDRTISEIELSYNFAVPFNWMINDKPVIKNIRPAIRYSDLNTQFSAAKGFPAPSLDWDWQKLDVGLNIEFQNRIHLTIEYNKNTFVLKKGTGENNELLVTLSWRKRFY